MFESIKYKSKNIYYSQKIIEYKDDAKRTPWNVMKELIGKIRKSEPQLLINQQEVSRKEEIAAFSKT